MEKELEKIFDQFLEGKIDDEGIAYLEEIKEASPEEYQEFLELVAFEERVNQELKEQRSGELLADVIIKEIRKNETSENIELADNVLKRLRETPSRKLRKISTTKRRIKKKKKSNFTPWLVAAMVTISFGLGIILFQERKSNVNNQVFATLLSGELSGNSAKNLNDSSRYKATIDSQIKLNDGTLLSLKKDSEIKLM